MLKEEYDQPHRGMDLKAPVHVSDSNYCIDIETQLRFVTEYMVEDLDSHSVPPEDLSEIRRASTLISGLYEPYSKKWFGTPVVSANFLKKVTHSFDFQKWPAYNGSCPKVTVRQTWCPEQLRVLPRTFQIHWRLEGVTYKEMNTAASSGQEGEDDQIPFAPDDMATGVQIQISLRSKAKYKLRKARLQAAIAKWKVKMLTQKFYEKYGNLDGADNQSPLSSEIDSDESEQS